MMDKEKLIARIMKECEQDGKPVTREEAEEMAEMEIKANGIKHYDGIIWRLALNRCEPKI